MMIDFDPGNADGVRMITSESVFGEQVQRVVLSLIGAARGIECSSMLPAIVRARNIQRLYASIWPDPHQLAFS
jgi:hypothetical protein